MNEVTYSQNVIMCDRKSIISFYQKRFHCKNQSFNEMSSNRRKNFLNLDSGSVRGGDAVLKLFELLLQVIYGDLIYEID